MAKVEAYRRSAPNWWKTPQRLWLRRAIFQVHLWVGIAITLYVVVISLSGSALVFSEEIQDSMQGGALHVSPQPVVENLDQALRAIRAARPGFNAVGLENLGSRDRAVTLLMRPSSMPSSTNYRQVSFNPYTGKVLLDERRYNGVFGWLTNLHYYLLSGKIGLQISGYMAIALLLLCASGLVLWWPGVRRWASALVLRRRARWQRLNWDLHSVVGFWCCAALVVVTFTGVYFAFPGPVLNIVLRVTGGGSAVETNAKALKNETSQRPTMTVDEAIEAAKLALPANAPPGYLQLPVIPASPYRITGYYANTAPYSQLVQVTLDPRTGGLLAKTDTRSQPLGSRIIQYFFTVHAGSFGGAGPLGVAVKIIWVGIGLAPALLAVTGVLMFWNRKLRKLIADL